MENDTGSRFLALAMDAIDAARRKDRLNEYVASLLTENARFKKALSPSDHYMTRESVVEELLKRLEADLASGTDYCIGEDAVRELFEAYRTNSDYK